MFNIIFEELGIVCGTIVIALCSHAFILGICTLAYAILHW